ncbi:MAG: hypothetical protein SGJ24_13940 [Chloroflexota bacterium]|nr:hypothetical protein [Chloroflexota bacterium]
MKRTLISMLVVLTFSIIGFSAALAGTATFAGTLNSGDPTMPVVFISTPACIGQGVTPVSYDAFNFTVDASGSYTFSLTSSGTVADFASFYVYQGSFNPAAGMTNCILGVNSGTPKTGSIGLTAGTQYILVVIDDTFNQAGGSYSVGASGPGNIFGGGAVVTQCPFPRPSGSVIYSVPAGAPTFFEADLSKQNNFNLPAGTWYISEFSGDFAKVWLACEAAPFFIPTNAIAR